MKAAIDESGITPKAIPDAVLVPAVQAASLEDDEYLQKEWANLLTNAAHPNNKSVPPCFVDILRQVSRNEAIFLHKFYEEAHYDPTAILLRQLDWQYLASYFWHQQENSDDRSFFVAMDNLMRLGLIQDDPLLTVPNEGIFSTPIKSSTFVLSKSIYSITELGETFIIACNPPPKMERRV